MSNTLVISLTNKGYSLDFSLENEKYHLQPSVAEGNEFDLIEGLTNLSDSFYSRGVDIKYSFGGNYIPFPSRTKKVLDELISKLVYSCENGLKAERTLRSIEESINHKNDPLN